MYCSHCGAEGAHNFCSQCGRPLTGDIVSAEVIEDWREEVRYAVLLHFGEVRDQIAAAAAQARQGMTGEQFLELADKAFVPLGGISLVTVSSLVVPLYARLGIQTGKQRVAETTAPIGQVIVTAVCSLAKFGRELKRVQQAHDGCVLQATLPSDWRSFAGELVITIEHAPRDNHVVTRIQAHAKIPGQWYDWGKSNQCLNQLFADVQGLAGGELRASA
jgi:hypothetical protein